MSIGESMQQQAEQFRNRYQSVKEQIGRVMDLTPGNVGFLIHTALRTLRERLEPSGAAATSPSGPQLRASL